MFSRICLICLAFLQLICLLCKTLLQPICLLCQTLLQLLHRLHLMLAIRQQHLITFIVHYHLLAMGGVIRQQLQLSKFNFILSSPSSSNQPLIVSHSLLINKDFTWTLHVLGHEIEKHANDLIRDYSGSS